MNYMLSRAGFLKMTCVTMLTAPFFISSNAVADQKFRVLLEPALRVRIPSSVVLISITRVENRLVAVGEHGVIILSDDNGRSWRQASVPVNVSIACVAFATALQGWAAGAYGVILNTVDGGETWLTQLDGTQVNQLMLSAAQQFDASNSGSPVAQRALRRANIFVAAGPDKPFLCILAIDAQNAIIFGAYRMAVQTSDGGRSWKDISLHIDDPISHNIYGLAVQEGKTYLAGEAGGVFESSDGNQNFVSLTQPAEATLFGIIASGNHLLTFGVAGNIFWSKDNGETWTPSQLATSANITAGRSLGPGQIMVVTEDGAVHVSKDGGVTFDTVAFNAGMSLFDLEQAANNDIVFAGDAGIKVVPLSTVIQ